MPRPKKNKTPAKTAGRRGRKPNSNGAAVLVSIRLPGAIRDVVAAYAEKSETSVSHVIVETLQRGLGTMDVYKEIAALKKHVAALEARPQQLALSFGDAAVQQLASAVSVSYPMTGSGLLDPIVLPTDAATAASEVSDQVDDLDALPAEAEDQADPETYAQQEPPNGQAPWADVQA